jgi:tRNA pseudouridine synthase 10
MNLKEFEKIIKEMEFNSFHVAVQYEEDLNKKELKQNELIQLIKETHPKAVIEKQFPDLLILFNSKSDLFELQIKPIYIYGKYSKFSRELPQTIHYCFKCKGKGCKKCNHSGKQSINSIQEILEKELFNEFNSNESKFHGAGREDKNVRMLGQRKFVFELINPKKRFLDLNKLEKKINLNNKELIETKLIDYVDKTMVAEIKEKKTDKKYSALIEFTEKLNEKTLNELNKNMKKEFLIKQQTPNRSIKSRANLLREKKIELIEFKKISEKEIQLKLICESGTYVKEFISGDEQRTTPSIASIIGIECICKELDVLEIIE